MTQTGPEEVGLSAVELGVVRRDRPVLAPLSLHLAPGATLAVTGPSGSGKSVLLWALAGATARSGSVLLDGVELGPPPDPARRGVVLLPEGNALAAALTATENVVIPLLAAGVPVAEAEERATAALATVGLEESGAHLLEELSGGQQQRLGLARALARRAAVLLADEPTSDLDEANRDVVVAALRAEAARGAVVVMATHDPAAAAGLDGELRLDDGVATRVR